MTNSAGRRRNPLVLGVVIGAIALNMRPGVASLGPVLPEIRQSLGLSAGQAAAMASLGVVCLGALAPLAPAAVRRWGLEVALLAAIGAIATGLIIRVTAGAVLLYGGTALACGGIAMANVLVPTLVKRDFARGADTMLGVYAMLLSASAALAAGATAPLGRLLGLGWRGALGAWAVPALVALLLWVPRLRDRDRDRERERTLPTASGTSLLQDARAWQVTTFFALLSASFYGLLVWLPSILRNLGYGATEAGLLLGASVAAQAPGALLMPRLATAAANQRRHAAVATGITGAGLVGLLVAPTAAPVLWMLLVGLGQGGVLSLTFTLFLLRSRTSTQTAQLSAMVQTVGYLIAATGPLLLGTVHDLTGSWRPALGILVVLLVPQLVVGLLAGRAGHVSVGPARIPC
jgi:CP family cyanate transporter-like MFS transporter